MHLNVAAALIVNAEGEVLCVKRGASKFASTSYRWEFPGGKLEPGETAAQAAVREVAEELKMSIRAIADAPVVHHVYPEFSIDLNGILCVCEDGCGDPVLTEHTDFCWCAPDKLATLEFAAADTAMLQWMRERAFGSYLKTKVLGRACTFLDTCTSTNDELLKRAEAGAPEGALVVSEVQTAGRGRLGRTWLSEAGQGLLFSLLLRPDFPPEIAATLPLVAGLAVTMALRDLGIEAGLKWPNDVLIGDKKICGILCEAQTSAKGIEGIVVGIGINVGAVPEAVAYRAVGLGGRIDRLDLLARVLKAFESLHARWSSGGLPSLRAELDALDIKRGNSITVKLGTAPTEGVSRGIRDDGALLLEHPDGSVEPILCGEIAQWD